MKNKIIFILLFSPVFLIAQNTDTIFMKDGHILCCTIHKIENNLIYCTREFNNNVYDGTINLVNIEKFSLHDYSNILPNIKYDSLPNNTTFLVVGDSIIKKNQEAINNTTQFQKKNKINKDSAGCFFPKNSIYFEFLGCGIIYSLNYERVLFQKNKNAMSLRIGASYWPQLFFESTWRTVPMLINYQRGINKVVSFEIGFGGSYIHYNYAPYNGIGGKKIDFFYFTYSAGFRFLINKHFLIKLDFTPSGPTINTHADKVVGLPYAFSGGLSLGYSFGLPEHLQDKATLELKKGPREYTPLNSIFFEGFGSGIYYSLNYDRVVFHKKYHSINCRIGYSIFPLKYDFVNIVPLVINYQYKLSKITSLEAGLGVRYVVSKLKSRNPSNLHGYHPTNCVDIIGNIGFRYLINKHVYIKTEITPVVINTSKLAEKSSVLFYAQFFGVSLGYTWGNGKQ